MKVEGRKVEGWKIGIIPVVESRQPSDYGDEDIRRTVGSYSGPENPIRRVWRLRERMLHLGIEFEDDDERIRKIVGREGKGEDGELRVEEEG